MYICIPRRPMPVRSPRCGSRRHLASGLLSIPRLIVDGRYRLRYQVGGTTCSNRICSNTNHTNNVFISKNNSNSWGSRPWVALLVQRYLSNAASLSLCVFSLCQGPSGSKRCRDLLSLLL